MSYHTGQQQTNQTDIQTEQTVQQTVTTVTPTVVDPTTEPLELTQLPTEGEQATALETEVKEDNPIVLINLQAKEGEWVFKGTGLPYVGKYHQHKNGEYMIGIGVLNLNHELKPDEIIIPNPNKNKTEADVESQVVDTYGIMYDYMTSTTTTTVTENEATAFILPSPENSYILFLEKVPNLTEFLSNFSNLFQYNCHLAGGYLRRVYKSGDAFNFQNSDLDFWFQSIDDLRAGINLVNNNGIQNYFIQNTQEYSTDRNVYQYDLVPRESGLPNLKIQLIGRLVGDINLIMSSFDFTNAKIATNGSAIIKDERFEIFEDSLTVNIDLVNDGLLRRLLRYLRIGNSTLSYKLNESSAFKLLTYVSDRKDSSVYMQSLYNLLLATEKVNYEIISTIEPNLNEIESSLPQGDVPKTNIPLNVSLIPAPPQPEVEDVQVENIEVENIEVEDVEVVDTMTQTNITISDSGKDEEPVTPTIPDVSIY